MLATYRRDDAVMLICQDNLQKRVEIKEMNDNAVRMLGYDKNSLIGKSLTAILPEREANLLTEYVEFEERGNDAAQVITRMRDFHLMDRAGALKPFFPKIIPDEVVDGTICFQLLLQPRASHTPGKQLRAAIAAQLNDEYPTPQSRWLAEIGAWQNVNAEQRVPSCLALLAVDQEQQIIEWHGQKALTALWEHVAEELRGKLREYDSVVFLGAGRLGLVLLDTAPEVVRVVLNRLRWQLTSAPVVLDNVGQISFSFSASYSALETSETPENLWKRLHTQLALSLREGENHLVAA